MNRRFDVASIHLFRDCNMHCKFCYREKESLTTSKTLDWWERLIPYLKKLDINQIAAGGGEPLMKPDWLYVLSRICSQNDIAFNFTTNGKLIETQRNTNRDNFYDSPFGRIPMFDWQSLLFEKTSMVSISFDSEKIKNKADVESFTKTVKFLQQTYPHLKIGVNYLCDDDGLKNLLKRVRFFMDDLKLDRVFALSPKNFENNILKYRQQYQLLTMIYPKFMVDDLTKCIIENNSYKNWKTPCHFGHVLSIDECGNVGGCSFDLGKVNVLKLGRPEDVMKLKDIDFKERFSCPYLMEGK